MEVTEPEITTTSTTERKVGVKLTNSSLEQSRVIAETNINLKPGGPAVFIYSSNHPHTIEDARALATEILAACHWLEAQT